MHIAVDGGQGGMRVALVRQGEVVAESEGSGFSYRPDADPVSLSVDAFADAWRALPAAPVERVWMGLTGAASQQGPRHNLALRILELTDAHQVSVGGDVVTAHAGALAGGDGVVIAVGTGTVCLAASADRLAVVDGHGAHLGDDGSGYAIGRAGLRAALAAMDGRGPATSLTGIVADHYGSRDQLLAAVYQGPATITAIASFAPLVAEAARDGDPVAHEIWQAAGEALANTVTAAINRTFGASAPGSIPVSWTGRLMIDLLRTSFGAALERTCPAARLVAPLGTGLAGAVLLTRQAEHRYHDLVATVTSSDQPNKSGDLSP